MISRIQNLRMKTILLIFFSFILAIAVLHKVLNYANQDEALDAEQIRTLENVKKMEFFRQSGTRLDDGMVETAFTCLFSNFRKAFADMEKDGFTEVYRHLELRLNVILFI